jgi:hypothetical protein
MYSIGPKSGHVQVSAADPVLVTGETGPAKGYSPCSCHSTPSVFAMTYSAATVRERS